jgi:predicted Zn-dependent protease
VSQESKLNLVRQSLEATSRFADGERTTVVYEDTEKVVGLANSAGFAATCRSTRHACWLWLEGRWGHSIAARFTRLWRDLEAPRLAPPPAAKGFGRALRTVDVLVPPSLAGQIVQITARLLTRNSAQTSAPLTESMGRKIASDAITLVDDPWLLGGPRLRPWDDEGRPTRPLKLISAGTLVGILGGLPAHAHAGGAAWRDEYFKLPQPRPSNSYFEPGRASIDGLLGRLGTGLCIEGTFQPLHLGPANKLRLYVFGRWVSHGELGGPSGLLCLTSGLFEFLKNVEAIGSDLRFTAPTEGAGAPSLLVRGLTVKEAV